MSVATSVATWFLFADVKGFSALDQHEIGQFLNVILPEVAVSFSGRHEHRKPAYCNTWGDAIFCIYDNPHDAARCGFSLCDTFQNMAWARHGLPELAIRVALHHGECHLGMNPITKRKEYLGTNVNLAARVEPIVAPNQVWATKRFVETLEPEDRERFHPLELGARELFKEWGSESLYRLSRRPLDPAEALQGSYYNNPDFPARGIHHVSLPVSNLAKSSNFYRNVLNLRESTDPEIMDDSKARRHFKFEFPGVWFEFPNGQQLHLIQDPNSVKEPVTYRQVKRVVFKDIHFAIRVRKYEEMYAMLEESKRKKRVARIWEGPCREQCYIPDPDWHIVEITGWQGPGPKRA